MFRRWPLARRLTLETMACCLVAIAGATAQTSPEPSFLVTAYLGTGQSTPSTSIQPPGVPWSVGATFQPSQSAWYIGFDFAGEGLSYNNTSGHYNDPEQGLSLNVLLGGMKPVGHRVRLGGGLVFGARITGRSCAKSYLGYQCYADESPRLDYTMNLGGMVQATIKSLMLGARITTESRQALLGLVF